MKTLIVTVSVLVCSCLALRGQDKKSVVIGTLIERPNAILVINPPNSDQGFLLPQLTSTQRSDIKPASPDDDGLMVYDTSDKSFYYWNNGAWVKGFGSGSNQTLSYDGLTQKLSLSSGNTIDLSTLKEIPTQTGNTGKFLTTNGTTLSWATISSIGDITGIITGTTSGLSGGVASGDATLSVNTDATTISINGTNQLQLSNNAVTTAKIAANAINSSHIIDGSVTGADIQDNSVGTADIINGSITGTKIGLGEVAPANMAPAGNDKVLTTTNTGAVFWDNKSSFAGTDNQNLSVNVNNLGISGGSGVDLSTLETSGDVAGQLIAQKIQADAVNSAKILDGSITTFDLANSAVTVAKIAPGANDQILTTDATGVVTWVNKLTVVDDNQNLTLTGNLLGIDNGAGVDLNNIATIGDVTGPLSAQVIQTGAVNSLKILDGTISTVDLADASVTSIKIGNGAVAPNNILSTGNDKILTTTAAGLIFWDDKSAFTGTDDQTLTLNSNLLSIDNGNSADLNNLLITGDVQGNLNNAIIQPNTITSAKIIDGTIAPADLAPGATNQVLTTNTAATAAQWVTPGGDVTGTVDASTVARIQGRGVSNAAPVVGQTLVWDGTNWVPTALVASTPTVQYFALDPSNFAGMQQDNDKDPSLGLLNSNDGQYAFSMFGSRSIVAAVNLPDGATIQSVTLFYQYTLLLGLAPLNAQLIRKPLGGGAVEVLSTLSPILSLGVSNVSGGLSKVVDNSTTSYRLLINFGNGTDARDAASATSRVYGVRIQYLK